MRCCDCVYCWKSVGERYPTCKFQGFQAPCEIEDDYEEEEEE